MSAPSPAPRLRAGTPADAERVADIWHTAWHEAHDGHVPDGLSAARDRASFGVRTAAAVDVTTLAEVDGEVVGFSMVVGDELEQLFVDAAHRGSGVAVALIRDAERRIAATHDVAWLAAVAGNGRARRFYEREGWVDEGDLPYEVSAGGTTYISPCRRYTQQVRPPS